MGHRIHGALCAVREREPIASGSMQPADCEFLNSITKPSPVRLVLLTMFTKFERHAAVGVDLKTREFERLAAFGKMYDEEDQVPAKQTHGSGEVVSMRQSPRRFQ